MGSRKIAPLALKAECPLCHITRFSQHEQFSRVTPQREAPMSPCKAKNPDWLNFVAEATRADLYVELLAHIMHAEHNDCLLYSSWWFSLWFVACVLVRKPWV